MDELFTRHFNERLAELPDALAGIISSGVICRHKAYVFQSTYTDLKASLLKSGVDDLSGFEYTQNRIHIDNYAPSQDVFSLAFKFADEFERVSLKNFCEQPIYYVLSFESDSEFGNSASFTFYAARGGQLVIDHHNLQNVRQPVLVGAICNAPWP